MVKEVAGEAEFRSLTGQKGKLVVVSFEMSGDILFTYNEKVSWRTRQRLSSDHYNLQDRKDR